SLRSRTCCRSSSTCPPRTTWTPTPSRASSSTSPITPSPGDAQATEETHDAHVVTRAPVARLGAIRDPAGPRGLPRGNGTARPADCGGSSDQPERGHGHPDRPAGGDRAIARDLPGFVLGPP